MTTQSAQSQIDLEARKGPETLEREIDQQRSEISDIVTALENRLSPNELVDKALSYARANGGQFAGNLGATIKANPVPALLTTVGLVWMMVGQNRTASNEVMSPLPERSGDLRSAAGQKADQLKSKADQLRSKAGQARERAGELRHDVSGSLDHARQRVAGSTQSAAQSLQQQARRARNGYQRLLDEQPLALGLIGVAVGALLGAALPMSQREDRVMGEASDHVADQVKDSAREGLETAKELGSGVRDDLRDELQTPAIDDAYEEPRRSSL
jgi:ElaB/YqjD/DUF883 family membrane-anchored ribosome-binding protein